MMTTTLRWTGAIRTWGEMIKFSHSVFALPFAVFAAFLASRNLPGGWPGWGRLGLIVVCMVAARSFAMTFNRIADAKLDARNPRTASRPIPAGRIRIGQAWVFTVLAAAVFLLACMGFHLIYENPWPLRLAAPVLVALALYSYAKRFTSGAHFVLGAAIAFAPVAAWIAVDPAAPGLPVFLLAAAVTFWIAGFDIIYACQDVETDRRDGLFSIPARMGVARALQVSRCCHMLTVGLLATVGRTADLGVIYWGGATLTTALLIAEQAVVKADDLSRVNLAFFTLNGCVSLLLGAAGVADLLLDAAWG